MLKYERLVLSKEEFRKIKTVFYDLKITIFRKQLTEGFGKYLLRIAITLTAAVVATGCCTPRPTLAV